jgi:hypothetical protein
MIFVKETLCALAVVPQPPYSPHLAPCNFFLFPKIKMTLKRWRFDDVEEIQTESQVALDAIQKEDFQKCFQKLENRCFVAVQELFDSTSYSY